MTATITFADLLKNREQTVPQLGEDKVVAAIAAHVAKHNELSREGVSTLCQIVHEPSLMDGLATDGEMTIVDEFGRVATEVATADGIEVGFPLNKYARGLGWTQDAIDSASAADFAQQFLTVQMADAKAIVRAIKAAIYTPVPRTVRDINESLRSVTVKPFLNGDGEGIPSGPNGEEFNADTHTHYLASATLTAAKLDELISTVTEHGHTKSVRVYIAQAQEAAVRALDGFYAYPPSNIVLGSHESRGNGSLDMSNSGNRAIGVYGAAEVWVKPTAVSGYLFAFDAGESEDRKPLGFREPKQPSRRGLRPVAENRAFPLLAKYSEHLFGVGVRCRTNGAVLYIGGASYVAPSL